MSDLHVIIPAGGAGTRLWPLSRRRRPKFLLDLAGTGRTLLQGTVDRLEESASSVTIVTGQAHRDGVLAQLPEFASSDDRTLLIEPSGRDSMAAIGLAAYVVRERFGDDAIVGSFAADHLIARPELLRSAVETAIGAAREGYVVTIGLTPTEASTAYGYIAPGPALGGDQAGGSTPPSLTAPAPVMLSAAPAGSPSSWRSRTPTPPPATCRRATCGMRACSSCRRACSPSTWPACCPTCTRAWRPSRARGAPPGSTRCWRTTGRT